MEIKRFEDDFTVSKLKTLEGLDLTGDWHFFAKTDEELSLVCPTAHVPENTLERDDDWKMFRIQGVLDFSLVGILAKISSLLAEHNISIFAISTFNTDYVLVKKESFEKALTCLEKAGYTIV